MRLFFHTPFLTKKNMIKSKYRINSRVIHINYPKALHIAGWYPFPALKCNQLGFITISDTPLGTFLSMLSNGYHGNDDCHKICIYVFSSFMTVQSFITIKRQDEKLSIIKNFKFLVSEHLNCFNTIDGQSSTTLHVIAKTKIDSWTTKTISIRLLKSREFPYV